MNRIILSTALALSLAAPAFASDQLALSLDVEPGTLSTAELISLRSALENDEQAAANAIRSGAVTKGISAEDLREITLRAALQDDEFAAANFIRKGGVSDVTVSTKSGISAGQAQLAASLGVDAADYSRAELVRLHSIQSSDNGRN